MANRRSSKPPGKNSAARPAGAPPTPPKPAAPAADDDPRVAQVQRLIDLMVARGAVEVEVEEGGRKVRVRLREDRPGSIVHYPAPPASVPHPQPLSPALSAAANPGHGPLPAGEGDVFLSPMVGTFYRAPTPDAEPFVQVGDKVKPEGSLCIIEAMKVMNEIKAEFAAEVVAILVENGQAVEFGQPLFRLKRL